MDRQEDPHQSKRSYNNVAHRLSFSAADSRTSYLPLEPTALPRQDCMTPESMITINAGQGIAANTGETSASLLSCPNAIPDISRLLLSSSVTPAHTLCICNARVCNLQVFTKTHSLSRFLNDALTVR